MSAYKRYATVAYDRQNFSILSIESISPPGQITYNTSDFHDLFLNLFTPKVNDTSDNAVMVDALLVQLGWLLRLYQDDFGDDQESPVNFLRDMLIIPIQFTTAAWQFANATAEYFPGLYALPSDLITTASAARVTARVMATPWTVYVFISVASVLYVWGASVLCWVLFWLKTPSPNTSGFLEVDVSSKMARLSSHIHGQSDEASGSTIVDLSSMLQRSELGNAESSRIAKVIKGKRLRVQALRNLRQDESHIVLVLVDEADTGDDVQLLLGSGGGERLEPLIPGNRY
jgi:hypothetical protein